MVLLIRKLQCILLNIILAYIFVFVLHFRSYRLVLILKKYVQNRKFLQKHLLCSIQILLVHILHILVLLHHILLHKEFPSIPISPFFSKYLLLLRNLHLNLFLLLLELLRLLQILSPFGRFFLVLLIIVSCT